MYKNLSIFHHGTNRTYNFGEYHINEERPSHPTSFQEFQNTSFPKNSRISVCLPFRRTFNTTEKVSIKSETNFALRVLTVVGLSISGLFLIILLVTYGIFEDLRTLPGLNLMSLSISMLSSHLIWLIGTAHFKGTTVCEVLTVIEHYLFLVTFMSMSIISYHSCVVFSQIFSRISGNRLKQFAKYSTIVWITPGVFVAVCVTLDRTETAFDIYGNTCWLSTDKAVLYLFLLPAAVLLVGNIYTFIKTALAISRFDKDTRILRKDRKKNLAVCAKLATLVGFPWIFAFFGVIFPKVEVFEYLFVIFTSLQGTYIGMAFVCNKKTLQLYRKWWKSSNMVEIGSDPRNQTFQMS
ncbi:adhesion G-protein coupled receptor G2-like [Dendronephthya gigantea]|uniref:adhesion G-protein coupled receptor G2-like n=1 Tax=Dendronephthya gigantea TaxID=151771 RepID=UPI001069A27E|nr:adhesion G-protein coupled receptor G2-like [Dendronephthya gigantea]